MIVYQLAKPGVFHTVQGEGILSGVPMTFVRLAGCSVGCRECDTQYAPLDTATAEEIAAMAQGTPEWVWITGGEPLDQDVSELVDALAFIGHVAIATSGSRRMPQLTSVKFVSVSPHHTPDRLLVREGDQLNLVPGLNGLSLRDWRDFDARGFRHRYVTPMGGRRNLDEAVQFVREHEGWKLGVQAHKVWGIA